MRLREILFLILVAPACSPSGDIPDSPILYFDLQITIPPDVDPSAYKRDCILVIPERGNSVISEICQAETAVFSRPPPEPAVHCYDAVIPGTERFGFTRFAVINTPQGPQSHQRWRYARYLTADPTGAPGAPWLVGSSSVAVAQPEECPKGEAMPEPLQHLTTCYAGFFGNEFSFTVSEAGEPCP